MDFLFILFGTAILLFFGNLLVKGGSSLARYLKVSPFLIGITVISFGTSAPELFVSINALAQDMPDIALGNLIGSNISNIGLVMGVTALIIIIPVNIKTIKTDYLFLLVLNLIFVFFISNLLIVVYEGIILISLLILYIFYIVNKERKTFIPKDIPSNHYSPLGSFFAIVFGCAGLIAGSTLLVKGAENLALTFGVSERVISISIVAFGTSLPELTTSALAAFKKEIDISVGNIIGSNIFNLALIAGIGPMITPIKVNPSILSFDIYFMIGFLVLLGLFFLPFKRAKITRLKAGLFILTYLVYIILLFSL